MNDENIKSIYWKRFVNALAYPVLILSQSGEILYANREAGHMFGRDSSALIGQIFSYPMELDATTEIEVLHPDQLTTIAEMHTRLGVWEGKPAWIVTLHDIADLKKSLADLKLAATVFKYTAESILITDKENKIVDVNDEFTRVTGYKKEEVLGKSEYIKLW